MRQHYQVVEEKIGYTFKDKTLIQCALTHSNYADHHGGASYERLEFLGDAVVNLVLTEELMQILPQAEEGILSHVRSILRSNSVFQILAEQIGVREGLRARAYDPRNCANMLSDSFEAILGAVYLDGGKDSLVQLVRALFDGEFDFLRREAYRIKNGTKIIANLEAVLN